MNARGTMTAFFLFSAAVFLGGCRASAPISSEYATEFTAASATVFLDSTDADVIVAVLAPVGATWVGFGMNGLDGEMGGADFVVCDGTTLRDLHGDSSTWNGAFGGQPTEDFKMDWVLDERGDDANGVWCKMRRSRTTCEGSAKDFQVHESATVFSGLVAYGSSPWPSYHENRGSAYTAFEAASIGGGDDDTSMKARFVAPDYIVPQVMGIEVCSYHEFPDGFDLEKLYHITNVRTTWDQKSDGSFARGMAHHITLFACRPNPEWTDGEMIPVLDDPNDPTKGNCNARNRALQDGMRMCNGADLTGQTVNIRGNEGIPMGKGVATAVVFLRHFYNQENLAGVLDTQTTFELTYTESLRPYTLGKYIVQTTHLTLNPYTTDKLIQVLSPEECQEANGAIKLTAVNVHLHDRDSDATHVIGRHIRNVGTVEAPQWKELKPFVKVENFKEGIDEGWMQINVDLLPTDRIILECTYTNPTAATVIWGPGFNDQMCVLTFNTRSATVLALSGVQDNGREVGKPYYHNPDDSFRACGTTFTGDQRQNKLQYIPYDDSVDGCGFTRAPTPAVVTVTSDNARCPPGFVFPSSEARCKLNFAHLEDEGKRWTSCADWGKDSPRCFTRTDMELYCWNPNGVEGSQWGKTLALCVVDSAPPTLGETRAPTVAPSQQPSTRIGQQPGDMDSTPPTLGETRAPTVAPSQLPSTRVDQQPGAQTRPPALTDGEAGAGLRLCALTPLTILGAANMLLVGMP